MPLRLVLWLVVTCLVGGALGVSFVSRPAAPAPVVAPAPRVAVVHRTALPPRRVYRHAHVRPGLVALPVTAAEPSPLLEAGSVSTSAPAPTPVETDVMAFTQDRALSDSASPSPSASGPISTETVASTAPAGAGDGSAPTAAVSTTPITISGVHTVSLGPTSATIAWRTSEPVSSRIAYGQSTPTLWTDGEQPTVDHVAEVGGLTAASSWNVWVTARADDGRTANLPYMLTTPPAPATARASIADGALQIDGQPYFPTIVWNACPYELPKLTSLGVDLFMANACGDAGDQATALGGRGFALASAKDPADAGAVGTYLPDEWDTFLPGSLTLDAARRLVPPNGAPGPRFLTLTNHFYSKAAPLPQGRGMYPALVEIADVLGFDLYPLQNWCRYDSFGDVFDSQQELVTLARGKPTFQWIEVRHMDCKDPKLDPSADTVRAETWLAIAGGAHAIGYFPNNWDPSIDREIARSKNEMRMLAPALLEPAIAATASNPQVRVSARAHNGAVYVIAVNASRNPASTTFNIPQLGNRGLVSLAGDRATVAASGSFSDVFNPLEVRVYISAPTS